MSNLEHYFENLLLNGQDVAGDLNKDTLSQEQQEAVEVCVSYVLYSIFNGRDDLLSYMKKDDAQVCNSISVEDELDSNLDVLVDMLRNPPADCDCRQIMLKAADVLEEHTEVSPEVEYTVNKHADRLISRMQRLLDSIDNRLTWHPVTEPPRYKAGDEEEYKGYLVYANGYYEVADYTTEKFDNTPYFHVDGEYEPDVTHWMPLPEPPKEEV